MAKQGKRPGKVISITRDIVTDEDYEAASELQAMTLRARRAEIAHLERLKQRLDEGALDTSKDWYFDVELGIVRRRNRRAG